MIIEASILANLLKEPVTKSATWLFGKTSVAIKNRKIENSLQGLSEKIIDVAKVKTIYKNDSSIDLHEFYIPTRVKNVNIQINKIIDIDEKNIVLEGTVGQGKSIFMRYLTYQEARLGKRIPIFLELRKLETNQSLEDAVSSTIAEWIPIFSKKNFHVLAESGNLVLFLDGFDEVSRDKIKGFLNEIERWHRYYPKMQMIISSRPGDDIQNINAFKVSQLDPYKYPEQKALIDKLVQEADVRNILKESIEESNSEIKGLLTTPLMVTLYVMIYRASSELPKTQSEFYKNIFSILSTRHDKTKPGYKREFNSSLDEVKLQEIFEHFCFTSFRKDELIFSYPRVIEIVSAYIKNKNIKSEAGDILQDFSKVVCLLPVDGLNYTFVHKSIQEYFCASFIIKKSESFKKRFYSDYLNNFMVFSNMKTVIDFLKDGDRYSYNNFYYIPLLEEYIRVFDINEYSNKVVENILIKVYGNNKVSIKLLAEGNIRVLIMNIPKEINNIVFYTFEILDNKKSYSQMTGLHNASVEGLKTDGYVYLKDYLNEHQLSLMNNKAENECSKLLDLYRELKRYVSLEEDYEYE